MQATLNICHNPFHPALDRVQKPIQRKVKINTLVHRHSIDVNKPVICLHNGAPVLRAQWGKTLVCDKDVVSFVYLPQGGGGSNPLRLILTIGLMVLAPQIGAALSGALGATGIGASLINAGIGMLGNALINALVPPPKPPSSHQQAALAAPSPTYSIGAQGNQARIGQAIPVLYGRMRMYPDFAAQPYAEFENNEQYLYQLFTVTQGYASVTDIQIEDSPITSFGSDYQVEIVSPNTASTLYPTEVYNVSEVAGQELLSAGPLGPFVAGPASASVKKIAFDVVLPRGLCYINDDGGLDGRSITFRFYAQPVDSLGVPTGASVTLGTETISAATQTPIRKTYGYTVTPARYRITAERTSAKDSDSRAANDLLWASARAYSAAQSNYGALTMLAVKLKATNTISNQSSRKINCVAHRQLPIPTLNAGVYTWSAPQQTSSIAWALADMCRANYGGKLIDSRFNIAHLQALDTLWTSRGDTLNGVFDSQQTLWEALNICARAGRARAYAQGGMLHFARDTMQTLPTAMFSSRNIVKNSFKLTYVMPGEDNADAVDVEYFDETLWRPRIVRAQLDVGSPSRPVKVKSFGITNRAQAFREGMNIAASNRYRRKEISFETELEGHIPAVLDLIAVQSDIPEWGQSAEVIAVNSISSTVMQVTVGEPLVWENAVQHYLMLRRANGSAFGPVEVSRIADDVLQFNPTTLDFTINTALTRERTHVSFGRAGQVVQLARVLSTVPNGNTVRVTAINEDPRVHAVDGTEVPDGTYIWSLPTPKVRPVLADFTISQTGSGTTPSIALSWAPAAGASYYVLEKSTDNQNWATLAEVTGSSFSFLGTVGTLYVRIAAFGGVLGPYITKSLDVGAVPPPPNVPTGSVSVNGQTYDAAWQTVADCDGYVVEIYNGASLKRSFNLLANYYAYTLENALADGGPWRSVTFKIYATKGAVKSATALTMTGTNAAPVAPIVLVNPGANNVAITVAKSDEVDYAGTLIHVSTTAGFTPSPANLVYEGTGNFYLAQTTSTLYIKAAHYDTYGKTGLNYSAEYSSTPTSSGSGIMSVSVLPAPVDNGLVYLTTDDQIYTSDGTSWVAVGSVVPDGSITGPKIATNAIDATKITAGAVTATKINVANLAAINANMGSITAGNITLDNAGFIQGGQSAYNAGTGFFMGYSTDTFKLSVGNATKGITWDGAIFTIKGDLVAGSININNRFIVDSDGKVTIKSALTGQRTEFIVDTIYVYDSNNIKRLQIGNLA